MQTKENTLYLPIKQQWFNQIVAGTKKAEYREVKMGITANRYLLKDSKGNYLLNPAVTIPGQEYYIDDYNDGQFPFLPRQYEYLDLAVGYAKERDTCTVEVTGISFEVGKLLGSGERKFAWWVIVYHLGNVVKLHRK